MITVSEEITAVCAAELAERTGVRNGVGGFYMRQQADFYGGNCNSIFLMCNERVVLELRDTKLNRTVLPVIIKRLNREIRPAILSGDF